MTTWNNQGKFSGQTGVAFDSTYTFDDMYLEFDGTVRTMWGDQSKSSTSFTNQPKSTITSWSNQTKN